MRSLSGTGRLIFACVSFLSETDSPMQDEKDWCTHRVSRHTRAILSLQALSL